MENKKESCWGCDQDYLEFYSENDLCILKIYGQKEFICVDCIDELPEDYQV